MVALAGTHGLGRNGFGDFFTIEVRRGEPVAFDFVEQGVVGEAEVTGGLCAIPMIAHKLGLNAVPFKVFDSLT